MLYSKTKYNCKPTSGKGKHFNNVFRHALRSTEAAAYGAL